MLVANWVFGVFFMYTPNAFMSITLGFLPLVGLYAYRTMEVCGLRVHGQLSWRSPTSLCCSRRCSSTC